MFFCLSLDKAYQLLVEKTYYKIFPFLKSSPLKNQDDFFSWHFLSIQCFKTHLFSTLRQMLDPGAKSLVFSTWTDVLDILASALTENDIPFAALQDQGKFKRNLEKFKVKLKDHVLLR